MFFSYLRRNNYLLSIPFPSNIFPNFKVFNLNCTIWKVWRKKYFEIQKDDDSRHSTLSRQSIETHKKCLEID